MSDKPLHLGIDLGTTNSSAAVFDALAMTMIRNSQGSPLTPSIVRVDARGRVVVGTRARKFLETDPDNTRAEFKRLMGTKDPIPFPAAGVSRRPEELAAEVLRSLRQDVAEQLGFLPETAVVCVPALFELPQSAATSEAARLAGFRRVELLQEPVASALASGWSDTGPGGKWLVFDLGAGTFDASLLETRDGMLRIVGHDGDNFLGGRDLDWAIVDWALVELGRRRGVEVTRAEPVLAAALRALKLAAEEAKIELSRAEEVTLVLPEEIAGDGGDLDVVLSRADLERIASPLIDRAVAICARLIGAHRTTPVELARVVLVGGPTAMPVLRRKVVEALGAPIAEGVDPMTIVAQGAAIYAASAGLDARPERSVVSRGRPVVLHFPAISTDLRPYVVGRVADGAEAETPSPARIRLVRADGAWSGEFAEVGADGTFMLTAELVPRRPNVFSVEGVTKDGATAPLHPPSITIVQGMTITDPPLSRSIGVALANDDVEAFFRRGDPLPARRTVTLHTVESVASGCRESLLKIPFVQGEFAHAHLCRLVGTLEIPGDRVQASVPAGTPVEVTIEVDRGGKIAARAFVPALDRVFEEVAHVAIPSADPKDLQATLTELGKRVDRAGGEARRGGDESSVARIGEAKQALAAAEADLAAAIGGDSDAAQKVRRTLLEVDATLEEVEAEKRWPDLDQLAKRRFLWATGWIEEYGTPTEKRMLQEVGLAIERARRFREALELERQVELARQLGLAAYYRSPRAWESEFDYARSQVERIADQSRAQKLLREGEKALGKRDNGALRDVVRELWKLLPPDAQERQLGFDSGVR